jgi:hypothetical protein
MNDPNSVVDPTAAVKPNGWDSLASNISGGANSHPAAKQGIAMQALTSNLRKQTMGPLGALDFTKE